MAMSSRSQLPKKHNKPVLHMMQYFIFSFCLGVVLVICLLYFTDIMNNSTYLVEVVSPKQVDGHPFGKQYNFRFNTSLNTMKGQDRSHKNIDGSRSETGKPRRLQDFRHEWLRQRRARVDWKSIMKPCADNMAWGLVKERWGKTNRSNATTSDIIFKDIRPAGEFSKIFIQSKTSDNRTKLIGGDTWRVFARGPAGIAATVFDHNNGTYEALFLITEPGVYKLMIYLDYSLCTGFKDPPRDWFITGGYQGRVQKSGVLGPLDDYMVINPEGQRAFNITVTKAQLKVPLSDQLEDLSSCSETCKYLWDGFGQWKNEKWMPYLKETYNWSMAKNYKQSGTLWVFGDSVSRLLYKSVNTRPLCNVLYERCNNSYMWAYRKDNEKLFKERERNLDFRPEKVIETVVNVLRKPEMQQEESTLLLNLVLHYVRSINFTTYQKLTDDLILVLKAKEFRQGERILKYPAKIIWKSSTAICKESYGTRRLTHLRFATSQRVALFSAYSISAMCKAGFDVIDVYPLSDSYPPRCKDYIHYNDKVFDMMETMLEQYKVHDNKKLDEDEKHNIIKRCISKENF